METKKLDILPILQIQLPSASNILTAMIFVKSVFGSGAIDVYKRQVQTGEEHEIDDKMASAVNVVKIDVESYTAKACIR